QDRKTNGEGTLIGYNTSTAQIPREGPRPAHAAPRRRKRSFEGWLGFRLFLASKTGLSLERGVSGLSCDEPWRLVSHVPGRLRELAQPAHLGLGIRDLLVDSRASR